MLLWIILAIALGALLGLFLANLEKKKKDKENLNEDETTYETINVDTQDENARLVDADEMSESKFKVIENKDMIKKENKSKRVNVVEKNNIKRNDKNESYDNASNDIIYTTAAMAATTQFDNETDDKQLNTDKSELHDGNDQLNESSNKVENYESHSGFIETTTSNTSSYDAESNLSSYDSGSSSSSYDSGSSSSSYDSGSSSSSYDSGSSSSSYDSGSSSSSYDSGSSSSSYDSGSSSSSDSGSSSFD